MTKKTFLYTISYDPIYTKYHTKMPEELKTKYEEYFFKMQNNDLSILNDLELLSKKYKNPVLNNLLYNCYILADRYNDAIKMAEYNFKNYPDYLFGRLNYASSFLLRKDYSSIPKIFDFQFDLKSIEPSRDTFHISEVLSFYKTLYYYHTGLHEYRNAKRYLKIIAKIDFEGKVKKELIQKNRNINIRRIITTILSILLIPFMLIFVLFNLIKDIIVGNKMKYTSKLE